MATKMVRQTMFTTGEVDVINWKRTDIELYMTAAQSLLNMEVGTTGLAKKRKGTKFLLDVTAQVTPHSKMYEFVDKNGNYYIILLADQTIYVYSDMEGIPYTVVTHNPFNVVTLRGNQVVAGDIGMSLIQTITSMPYLDTEIPFVDYSLSNDVLYLTHPKHPPARLYISDYTTAPPTFAYQVLNIYPFPAYDFGNINYNATTVTLAVAGSVLTIAFAGLPVDATYTNDWIGGQIVGGGATDIQPIGYAIITAVVQVGTTVTFTATVQIPFQTVGYATSGAQYSIRQPTWSATLGWPAKVNFYQNRLWLGNSPSLPTTIIGSQINSPVDFDVGTGLDTDAIIYTIGQNNSGAIQWINGGKQLEVYCLNNEFAAPQDQNIGLTPTTFSIRQQSSYGCSSLLKPVTYINDSYYASITGQAIINFHFNGVGLTYQASNISVASSHLVNNPQRAMLVQGDDVSQDNFIYFLTAQGTMTSFQFANEVKLAALTPIDFNTNPLNEVFVKDIVTVNNQLYLLKTYMANGNTVIELMTDEFRMDSCLGTGMGTPTNQLSQITGLDKLNGYHADIVYENQDYGISLDVNGNPAPISGGSCYVFNPNGSTGHVTVGLLYSVALRPMYVYAGALEADYYKQIVRIYVDYYNSLDFEINGVTVPFQNFADIQLGLPLSPQTDTAVSSVTSGWNRFDTFTITQTSPFDLQITSIAYQIDAKII